MTLFFQQEYTTEMKLTTGMLPIQGQAKGFLLERTVGTKYNGHWKSGHILYILHVQVIHILIHYLSTSAWLDQCQSAIVYERRETKQVLYVIPVSSILGRLPLVPVGATGTIPFAMRRESDDFPGAFCDKSENSGDGCR